MVVMRDSVSVDDSATATAAAAEVPTLVTTPAISRQSRRATKLMAAACLVSLATLAAAAATKAQPQVKGTADETTAATSECKDLSAMDYFVVYGVGLIFSLFLIPIGNYLKLGLFSYVGTSVALYQRCTNPVYLISLFSYFVMCSLGNPSNWGNLLPCLPSYLAVLVGYLAGLVLTPFLYLLRKK